jgi:glycosyltransferase involved in cell wall biosynthesis
LNIPLSVIICTHNPKSDYLNRTLESLKAQSLPRGEWELLLIDNCSAELLSQRWDLSWHPLGRHVREDELGLTAARARAINEAVADQMPHLRLIVLTDDDARLVVLNAVDAAERGAVIRTRTDSLLTMIKVGPQPHLLAVKLFDSKN